MLQDGRIIIAWKGDRMELNGPFQHRDDCIAILARTIAILASNSEGKSLILTAPDPRINLNGRQL